MLANVRGRLYELFGIWLRGLVCVADASYRCLLWMLAAAAVVTTGLWFLRLYKANLALFFLETDNCRCKTRWCRAFGASGVFLLINREKTLFFGGTTSKKRVLWVKCLYNGWKLTIFIFLYTGTLEKTVKIDYNSIKANLILLFAVLSLNFLCF